MAWSYRHPPVVCSVCVVLCRVVSYPWAVTNDLHVSLPALLLRRLGLLLRHSMYFLVFVMNSLSLDFFLTMRVVLSRLLVTRWDYRVVGLHYGIRRSMIRSGESIQRRCV